MCSVAAASDSKSSRMEVDTSTSPPEKDKIEDRIKVSILTLLLKILLISNDLVREWRKVDNYPVQRKVCPHNPPTTYL